MSCLADTVKSPSFPVLKNHIIFSFDPNDIERHNKRLLSERMHAKTSSSYNKQRFKSEMLKFRNESIKKSRLSTTESVFEEDSGVTRDDEIIVIDLDNKRNKTFSIAKTPKEFKYVTLNNQNVLIEKHGGLFNKRVLSIFTLWYLFSALTLFTNKNILTKHQGNPTMLGKTEKLV